MRSYVLHALLLEFIRLCCEKLVVIYVLFSYTTDLLNLTLPASCVGVMLVSINLLCFTVSISITVDVSCVH